MFSQELLSIFSPLADALARIAKPRASLFNYTGLDSQIEQLASSADAFTIHDVKFDLAERGSHLVFYNFDARLIAHNLVSLLYLTCTTNLQPNRRIELQRIAPGSRLRIPKHYADFHTDLI